MGTILVTGATGNIGRELVRTLHAAGADVLAGSTRGVDVEGVPGRRVDFTDTATLTDAFHNIDRLFLLFPLVPDKLDLARNAVEAARAAGVRYILRSSGAGADTGSPVALSRLQGEVDAVIAGSGIDWTVIRPSNFMQNIITLFGGMVRSGTLYLPHADGRSGYIDVRDIAGAAAAILSDPAPHAGRAYPLTGPEALSVGDIAAQLSAALGRDIRYVPVDEDSAVAAMRERGSDPWMIAMITSLNRAIAGGDLAGLTDDARRLLGREPRRFADFAREHAGAWS